MRSDSEPEPEPRSKGEAKRNQILLAIRTFVERHEKLPTPQDIQEMTGIRSFNTLTRHLSVLAREGAIEWDSHSATLQPAPETPVSGT